jgi:hypothetical protein
VAVLNQKIERLIYWLKITVLLALLTACSDSKAIENWLAADPELNQESRNSKPSLSRKTDNNLNKTPTNSSTSAAKTAKKISLPVDFPNEIPLYPQAELLAVDSQLTATKGETIWRSPNSQSEIISYYQQELLTNGWKVSSLSTSDVEHEPNNLVANRDQLQLIISINKSSLNQEKLTKNTEFIVQYQPNPSATSFPLDNTSTASISENSEADLAAINYFSDLDETPEQLSDYVKDVAALGILTPYKTETEVEPNKFKPNEPITRRDYAHWLVAANNKYYANSPANKIHLATQNTQPAFQDISVNDPDFAIIQGLAEAGLIPSMLTSSSDKLLFRPNAPLTREDLITWKIPLDLRKALPSASIDTIKESWGFQDAANISPEGLRALFADFQNGDQANISRVLGYTTLFQPKKVVTRAEAAASLWYFGFQGDGITAQEIFAVEEN